MKVEDIRPTIAMDGQSEAVARDVAWLSEQKHRFVPVDCPACNSQKSIALYEKFGVQHVRCAECDTQYVTPRPSASLISDFLVRSEHYALFARSIFPASAERRRELIFRPRAARVLDAARRIGLAGGTLMEIGAGYGFFCEEILRHGFFDRVVGLEPSPEWAQVCRKRGIEVVESVYEEADYSDPVDIVVCFEVIEHLFDPAHFVRWVHAKLGSGGILYLTCPNIAGFETRVLGAESTTIDHEHINLFNPKSLSYLLESNGFEVLEVSTPGHLDVDLVEKAYRSGIVNRETMGDFLADVLDAPQDVKDGFQTFLREQGLSSNMMVLARRA